VMSAILRYNNSVAYAQNVLGWAAAYATGVVPIDLPPITGPIPPLADSHLDNYQGLGPGLPMNALGLPANDPLALVPLVNMGNTDVATQMFGPLPGPPPEYGFPGLVTGPAPGPAQNLPPGAQQFPQQNCAVFCLGTNPPPAVQPQLPPEALPPGVVAPLTGPSELAPPVAPAELATPAPSHEGPQEPAPALLGPQGAGPLPGPPA
jgi:hypothetical protein